MLFSHSLTLFDLPKLAGSCHWMKAYEGMKIPDYPLLICLWISSLFYKSNLGRFWPLWSTFTPFDLYIVIWSLLEPQGFESCSISLLASHSLPNVVTSHGVAGALRRTFWSSLTAGVRSRHTNAIHCYPLLVYLDVFGLVICGTVYVQ